MPIEFAQPEPVAPLISSSYGQAAQWSQDAPTLANLAEATAAHRMQSVQMAQQQLNANAELNYRAQNDTANRYFAGDSANADRQQQANNIGAELTQRNDAITFQGQAENANIRQHGEMQAYVNAQDMTQKEQMQLRQQQQALSDVWNDPGLSQQEKTAMATQIKTGIDPLAQKLKATQQKHLELQNQQIQTQTAHDLVRNQMQVQYANSAFDQLVKQKPSPDAAAEYGAEADQQGLQGPAKDAYIAKRAGETGRMSNWVFKPSSDGRFEWSHVPPDKTTKDDAQKQQLAAWKDYHAARDAASKETDAYMKVEGNQGKDWHSIFNDTLNSHGIAPTFAEHLAQFGLAPGQPAKGGRQTPPPGAAAGQPNVNNGATGGQGMPEEDKAKVQKIIATEKPFPVDQVEEKGTPDQKQAFRTTDMIRQNILNSNLPTPEKEKFINAAGQVQNLISEFGSIYKMKADAENQSLPAETRDRAKRSAELLTNALNLLRTVPDFTQRPGQQRAPQQAPQQVPQRPGVAGFLDMAGITGSNPFLRRR